MSKLKFSLLGGTLVTGNFSTPSPKPQTLWPAYPNPRILYLRVIPLNPEGFLAEGPSIVEIGIFEKEPNDLTDGKYGLGFKV